MEDERKEGSAWPVNRLVATRHIKDERHANSQWDGGSAESMHKELTLAG